MTTHDDLLQAELLLAHPSVQAHVTALTMLSDGHLDSIVDAQERERIANARADRAEAALSGDPYPTPHWPSRGWMIPGARVEDCETHTGEVVAVHRGHALVFYRDPTQDPAIGDLAWWHEDDDRIRPEGWREQSVTSDMEAPAPSPAWSSDWPTVPGWYWMRHGDRDPEVATVLELGIEHSSAVAWGIGGAVISRPRAWKLGIILWGPRITEPETP